MQNKSTIALYGVQLAGACPGIQCVNSVGWGMPRHPNSTFISTTRMVDLFFIYVAEHAPQSQPGPHCQVFLPVGLSW